MKKIISQGLLKIARQLIARESALNEEEIRILHNDAPKLIGKVQKNKKNPFKDFSDEDKRVLLAYVIYLRQNLSTKPTDNPNYEDAAKILRKEVYTDGDKDSKKELKKELIKQLQKAGMKIK